MEKNKKIILRPQLIAQIIRDGISFYINSGRAISSVTIGRMDYMDLLVQSGHSITYFAVPLRVCKKDRLIRINCKYRRRIKVFCPYTSDAFKFSWTSSAFGFDPLISEM